MRAVVGLIGDGVEWVISEIFGDPFAFDMYLTLDCDSWGRCEEPEFGLKMTVGKKFDALIQVDKHGDFVFCFELFGGNYNSCGDGDNILLVLFEELGKAVVKVVGAIGEAIGDGVTAAVDGIKKGAKMVAELGEEALRKGELVIEEIGAGFEEAAEKVEEWVADTGEQVVKFAGKAKKQLHQTMAGAMNDIFQKRGTVHRAPWLVCSPDRVCKICEGNCQKDEDCAGNMICLKKTNFLDFNWGPHLCRPAVGDDRYVTIAVCTEKQTISEQIRKSFPAASFIESIGWRRMQDAGNTTDA